MASSIPVRGLGSNSYKTSEYILTLLVFDGKRGNDKVITNLAPRGIYQVNELKVKTLINIIVN